MTEKDEHENVKEKDEIIIMLKNILPHDPIIVNGVRYQIEDIIISETGITYHLKRATMWY